MNLPASFAVIDPAMNQSAPGSLITAVLVTLLLVAGLAALRKSRTAGIENTRIWQTMGGLLTVGAAIFALVALVTR